MTNLFISHSSRDNAAAKELQARLEEQGHHSVFLDLDPEMGIQAGVSWERTLYTKLRACRAVVALCSDSYLTSQWCFAEIALARMEGKELFVLQIDPWSEQTQMPSILTEEQFIDLRTNKDDGYQRLWNGFKVKGIVAEEHREWGPDDPPYPGLCAFDETDAPIFFGREHEVREGVELLNRVQRHGHPRLVMVLGSSGSGKSSLARAGLVPWLRRDGNRWLVVGPFRPGPQPARELAAALCQAFDRAGQARPWEGIHRQLTSAAPARAVAALSAAGAGQADSARQRLLQALRSMADELTDADTGVVRSVRRLEEFLASAPAPAQSTGEPPAPESAGGPLVELAQELRLLRGTSGGNVLLVIDQFEELLGYDAEATDHPANCFLRQLRDGLDAEDSPVLALATMRSDYLGALQRAGPLQGFGFKSLSVGPMSPEGMKEIIERPALLGQIQLGDGITDRLMRETGSSDALPLLAFTLRVMWDRYHGGRLLEMQHYEAIGKLEGAVAQVADDTLETALELGEEDRLRGAFLSLARPAAEGAGWTRQPVRWDELDELVQPMLQCFVDQRLLVKRGDDTVEVAHEALFRSWKKLRGWLDENAEALHLRREIHVDAAKWDEAPEAEKVPYLWRGGRLARALELKKSGVLPLKHVDRSFVEASDRAERADATAEEARRKRELRWARTFAIVVGTAFLVAAGLGLVALYAQKKATKQSRLARAGRLAALANSQPPEKIDEALMLAVQAMRTADLPETRDSLLRSLQSGPETTLPGHDGPVHAVAFAAQAEVFASGGENGTVLLWRKADDRWQGKPLPDLDPKVTVYSLALSASGNVLATGDDRGMVRLWSVSKEREVSELGEPRQGLHSGLVGAVAFSGNGKWLASGGKGGVVHLWELVKDASGRPKELGAPGDPLGRHDQNKEYHAVRSVAFSEDDQMLASAGEDGAVKVWATDPRGSLGTLRGHGDGWATAVAFSSQEANALVSGGQDGVVRLWSPDGTLPGEMRGTLLGVQESMVWTLALSPDKSTLVSGGGDGRLRYWRTNRGTWKPWGAVGAHEGFANGVAFSPSGNWLVTGGDDGRVRLWDVDTGGALGESLAMGAGIKAVAYRPDGKRLAWGDADGVVRIWDLVAWRQLPEPLRDHEGPVHSLAWSSKGGILVAGDDYGVLMWKESERGVWEHKRILDQGEEEVPVSSLAFSPDGDRFVAGDHAGVVWMWELAEGGGWSDPNRLQDRHDNVVHALAFSPDGGILLSGSADGSVRLWRKNGDGWSSDRLEAPGEVRALAFSRNGLMWITGGWNTKTAKGTVDVWRRTASDWQRTNLVELQSEEVYCLALSPSGSTVASAGWNTERFEGTLQLWDVERQRSLGAPLGRHGKQVWGVAFSPTTGDTLVSGGGAGALLLWNHDVGSWVKRACMAADPGLGPTDRRQRLCGEAR